MSARRGLVAAVAGITSRVPRIKGLGMVLAWPANYFRGWGEEVEARVFGSRMLLNSADYLSNIVLFTPNYYDRRERAVIATIVRRGDYVVDVGANIGIYTLLLARGVGPRGRVVAIEAEPANVARLKRNIALNAIDWITVCACGVSDKEEMLPMRLNRTGNAGAHSFVGTTDVEEPDAQRIRCVRLATLIDHDRAPRFMKIDVEGFEYRVLKAYFEDVAEESRPDYIMLEDVQALREDDAVALTAASGYRLLRRIDDNVFFERRGLDPAARIHGPAR